MASIGAQLARQMSRLAQFPTRAAGPATVQLRVRINKRAIRNDIDGWQRKVLFRTGGFGRTYIKRSMRPAPKKITNAFGKRRYKRRPPYSRIGTLRKLVLFDVDMNQATVSFGVAQISSDTKTRKKGGVPRLLEEGGTAWTWVLRSEGRGDNRVWHLEKVKAKYKRFPYIQPAKAPIVKQMAKIMEEEAV